VFAALLSLRLRFSLKQSRRRFAVPVIRLPPDGAAGKSEIGGAAGKGELMAQPEIVQ